MHVRNVAALGAALVATAFSAGTAAAAGGPPPPKGVGGATVTQVAAGLGTPTSFASGAGAVFEGDGGNNQSGPPNGGVFVLSGGTGRKLAGSPEFVGGLAFRASTLYVSAGTLTASGAKWQILAWSGWNGTTFTVRRTVWTAPKGVDGLNGIAFAPSGRLLLGVDLGLIAMNDHAPATAKTPYRYDILSMAANGTGLKVFASGIRQPWQLVFPAGSSSPFVSDLGQDKAAKNPPDFLLRVRQGDNYGFPQCNHTSAKLCRGYAKPFALFKPHADIMGLEIIGQRLYMTSFAGLSGKGPGGEVVSMPLSGGPATPVVTGFVAPTVGLGEVGGKLLVGELTGQVFAVTP